MRKSIVAATMAASLLAGGAIGVALFGPGGAGAQSTTTQPPSGSSGSSQGGTTFRSNEDTSHENSETPQREADENAGRAFFHGAGGSNENTAHENGETPEREHQEDSGTTTTTTAPPTSS